MRAGEEAADGTLRREHELAHLEFTGDGRFYPHASVYFCCNSMQHRIRPRAGLEEGQQHPFRTRGDGLILKKGSKVGMCYCWNHKQTEQSR